MEEAEFLPYNTHCTENACLPSKPISLVQAVASTICSERERKKKKGQEMLKWTITEEPAPSKSCLLITGQFIVIYDLKHGDLYPL